jgi:ankyrin repeat protein
MQLNGNIVPASVSDFYQRTRNEVKDQSWYIELQRLLCRVASTFSRCFFVVDALDEVEVGSHMPGLLELFSVLRRGLSTRGPKIFATSRKYASTIQNFFQEATKVTVAAHNDDLRTILAKIITDHQDSKYILDDNLREEILDKLCAGAHGMYVGLLWVDIFAQVHWLTVSFRFLLPILQIQDILSQLTRSEVRRALRDLSANLADAFESTIGRILNLPTDQRHAMNRRNLAVKALMWISHAKRVLTVTELQHALAVRLDESELDRENFIEPQLVVDSCFGLVEIDKESSTIRFVHYSLQEYLRSHNHGLFQNGDMEVTKVCLRYLSLDSVKDLHVKNLPSFVKALESLPFLNYAVTEWGFHAADVPPDDVKELALKFLRSSPHLLTAARVRDHKSPYFRKWHERMYAWAYSNGAGISLCASFGLTGYIRLLIGQDKKPMLKARNMYGSAPLHEAALRGYEDTAQLLLDSGADVLDVNIGKSIPLYLAVANSQLRMVRLLLQKQAGAQLDIAGKEGWTALHKAADMGNEEIVTVLLQHGAMMNVEDEKGMRPLHLAARKGYLEVVRLLILSNAQVHSTAFDRLTPLDHAVTSGHFEVTKMLLDNGAHIEHRGQDKWTALQRASRGGHEQIVALLLQRGADILTEDHKGEIPLHAATRSGNIRVVELLLNERPDLKKDQLSKRERNGSTPLDVAFFTAHFDIHKLLRAAEMETQEQPLTTIDKVTSAIENGKRDKVRRLLADKSFEIDALIDGRQPALHLAMQEEQIDIVRVLLEYGADINSIGYHGWTPLHVAAAIGNLKLTELCLFHGASVRALTDTAQTPLHKACSSKNVGVVKALLEAGAEKEAMNSRGMRPIHVAAHQNSLDTVRLLIETYRVSISERDKFGETAADWAEKSGHLDVLQCLKAEEKKRRKLQGVSLI